MSNDFETDKNGRILIGYHGSLADVIVPDGITFVALSSFKNSNIKSIVFPESLKMIGADAFEDSTSLEHVVIPNQSAIIMDGAFKGCKKLADENGFVIINQILIDYFGDSANVRIPDSITRINGKAFENKGINSVYIPSSVKRIGSYAFADNGQISIETDENFDFSKVHLSEALQGCTVRSDNDGLIIRNKAVVSYTGNNSKVEIPDGVSAVNENAFYGNSFVKEIIVPESVKMIGNSAFSNCNNLSTVIIKGKNVKLGINLVRSSYEIKKFEFYGCDMPVDVHDGVSLTEDNFFYLPRKLVPLASDFIDMLSDADIKNCILADADVWQSLSLDRKADTYIKVMDDKFQFKSYFKKCIGAADIVPLGMKIFEKISDDPSKSHLEALMWYLETYYKKLSDDYVKNAYGLLTKNNTDGSLEKRFNKNRALKEKLFTKEELHALTSKVENKVLDLMKSEKIDQEKLDKKLYSSFSLRTSDLPELYDNDGKKLDNYVLEWFLCTNRRAISVIKLLNHDSFYKALNKLADQYICNGFVGIKQCNLAYPLCRYADEDLMKKMCTAAPKLATHSSGNNSRAMLVFREAVCESDTRSAIMFADKYNDLDEYARIRGMDAETIRDTILSDTGLSPDGTKKYDLSSQTVTARLLPDLSFIVELPNGKSMKSIPKKGADEKLYAQANADFTSMKKLVKKIIRNRFSNLFDDSLSGKEKDAESWKNVYFNNPVLKKAAMLVVWSQGGHTFTMTDQGLIDSKGQPYELQDDPVVVAYPTEMKKEDIKQWQKYFTEHQLKQPFLQIWESVINPETVKADRYAGCRIPFYRFNGQEKHGIHVDDEDFHNEIYITFSDIEADVERIDWHRHEIGPDDCFCVESVKVKKPYTRRANHQLAYLDRITVWDRVKNDDITVQSMLPSFTLAQIIEFIEEAKKAKAVNVLAILMDYKNQNFPDYNAMDEFILDW